MKKLFISLIIFLLSASSTYAASTLWEYYAQKGLTLPSITERGYIARDIGISPYSGSYEQNVALLYYLQGSRTDFLGGSNPMSATDWQLSSAISNSATSLTLVSINDVRGNTPALTDFATTTYLVIDPNSSSNIEIVACPRSGITVSTKTFTGCTRGLAFYGSGETAVTANKKAHSAGSRVIQSNVGQFYNLFVDKWDDNTIYGNITFASTTASKVKVYLGSSSFYIWVDTSSGGIGFATSSNEYAWNASGTVFSAVRPLVLSGGNLTIATSTNDFKLDGSNNLAINASSTGGIASDSNGVYVDGSANFNFTGNVSGIPSFFGTGSDGNVTLTTGTTTLSRDMFYNNLTIPGDAELKTNGFKVYVMNSLTTSTATSGSGLITSNGGTGGTGAAGSAGNPGAGGTAGIRSYTIGTLPIPYLAGIGGIGGSIAGGDGAVGATGTPSTYGFLALAGANGGAGGASTGAGGAGGIGAATGTQVTLAKSIFENYIYNNSTTTYPYVLSIQYGLSSNAAGGGGGGGSSASGGFSGGSGGGGGANGGLIWISAKTLNGITIQAKGGTGGIGGASGGGDSGVGGGGGGGNGGIIILFYNSSSTMTTTVTGGTGGTGNTSGQNGQAGYVFNNDL